MEDGVFFRNYQQYRDLGVEVLQDGSMDQNIKERNIQGRKATAMLSSFLWERQIRKKNKKLIYNTIAKRYREI